MSPYGQRWPDGPPHNSEYTIEVVDCLVVDGCETDLCILDDCRVVFIARRLARRLCGCPLNGRPS